MRDWIGTLAALGFLVGCSGGGGPAEEEQECAMTNETINNSQWVMWEAMPGGKNRENTMARMQFFQEDGVQKVRYTVKSLADAYIYACEPRYDAGKEDQGIKEWLCEEESHLRDWCQSLEVHEEGSCTAEKLQELGAKGTPKEFEDAIKLARETAAKYRNKPSWPQFKLNNNNLGNKLQGLLYAKAKKPRPKARDKRCKISVTDMYMTIFNGKRVEDSNPVGTNAFIQSTDSFDYAHCTDPRGLFHFSSATLPEDLNTVPRQRMYEKGQMVYYHYIGEKEAKATEGCTYSRDVYAQWRPVKTGEEVGVSEEGVVQWNTTHTWDSLDEPKLVNDKVPTGVLKMVRYKTCADGKKEEIDVLCAPAFLLAEPETEEE